MATCDLCTCYTPVGNLLLGATTTHLVLCDWSDAEGNPRPEVARRLERYGITIPHGTSVRRGESALLEEAIRQLNEYFHGTRRHFTLPIKTYGTPFQQHVWQQLQTIPHGTTQTYRQQAATLGCPKAIRAVANANRLNALSIIIPCHRVIGTGPHPLTGYAGGLNAKRWLIEHEQTPNPTDPEQIQFPAQ